MAPCRLSQIQVALLGHMGLKEYDLGNKERKNQLCALEIVHSSSLKSSATAHGQVRAVAGQRVECFKINTNASTLKES